MRVAEILQSAFTSGELDPALHRRQNLAKYDSALATIENFFIHAHGGASNRAGFRFIAEVKDSSKYTRLIEFEFNTEQTYIIEMGEGYMRFYKDAGQIVETATTPSAITVASPGVITDNAHGYSNGDHVYVDGGDMVELTSVTPYIIASATTNTYQLTDLAGTAINTTGFTAYTTGASVQRIYEVASPYQEAELDEVKFTQSADTMTLCHPSYAPRKLTRTGDTAWVLSTITFGAGIAAPGSPSATPTGGTGTNWNYVITAVDADTGAESVASATATASNSTELSTTNFNTVTWAAVANAASYNVYRQRGSLFYFLGSDVGPRSFKDDGIVPDLAVSVPQAKTVFNTTDEYPATTTYYKQRQVFAQTNNDPQKLLMSVIADFTNFNTSLPLKASDAIAYRLVSRQVNEIRHLVPLKDLIILTSGGEWLGQGDNSGVVSANTFNVNVQQYSGASEVAPLLVNNTVVFIQEQGDVIRDLGYQLAADGYTGDDLTVLARHLFDGHTITDWAYAKIPYSIIWAVRSDGRLLGLTYNREQEVFAWHQHYTADSTGEGDFESVAAVPEGRETAVYVTVKRTINGATRRYVERLNTRTFATKADSFFVDSGLTYDGAATTTVSGLDHLEGETVNVLADGNILPQKTVTDGAIALGGSYSKVHVGLPITATLKMLPIDVLSNPKESSIPKQKNVTELTISVENTTGLFAGKDVDDLFEVPARQFENLGEPAALKSTELVIKIGTEWGFRKQPVIRQTYPVPAKIIAINPDVTFGG